MGTSQCPVYPVSFAYHVNGMRVAPWTPVMEKYDGGDNF